MPSSVRCPAVLIAVALTALTAACSKSAAEYAASGDAYLAEGKTAEAIVEYRNAVQANPQRGDVRLKLAKAYEQARDFGNAAREYVRAADQLPASIDVQLKAGSYLQLAGQFQDAQARADKALTIDPKSVDAQILKASAMAGLKDIDGAIREMEEALKIDPTQPRIYGSLGVLQMTKGSAADAEGAFRRAVALDPKAVGSHVSLGAFLLASGRQAEAEKSLQTAIGLDSQNVLANRALAVFYITTNRAAQAEPYMKTVAGRMPDGTGQLALADYYLGMRRTGEARTVLEGLLANERLFSDVRRRMGGLLFDEGKRAEAQKLVTEMLARNAKDAEALVMRARFERREGKRAEALSSARASIAANPTLVAGHYVLGELLAEQGDVDEAIASFNEVLRLNPRVTGAQVELARLSLTRVGGANTSIGYAEQALKNQPGNPDAQLLLARGLLARGDLSRAERETQALISRFPNVAAVQSQMGSVHVLKKDIVAARRFYDRALQIDPNFFEAIAGLASLDVASRQFDAARARVDAKIAERPTDAALIELGARTAMASGDSAGAEARLRRLIEVAPDRLSAYGLLARLYINQKKLDEARAELERMAAKDDRPVGPQTMIGMLYEQQGRPAEARKMYERVLEYEPRAAVAANNLAWIMVEANDNLDVALKYAQAAKEVLPDVAEVSDTLAWVYYKKNLASMAIEPLRHAIGKDPRNANYHYRLGLVYLKTGDSAKARQSLQQALAINPNFADAADAKAKLGAL